VIDDCVPINLFGGAGTITQDQVDFMSGHVEDNGHNSQRLANAQIAGPWDACRAVTFSGSLARNFAVIRGHTFTIRNASTGRWVPD